MTENPYKSPDESKSEAISGRNRRSGRFFFTTLLAAGAGLVIAQAMNWAIAPTSVVVYFGAPHDYVRLVVYFGAPVVSIFVACSICTYSLRCAAISKTKQLGIVLLTTLASYLLFVPICIAGGIAAIDLGATVGKFTPSFLGIRLASMFGAALAMNITFFFAFRILNRRHSRPR